MDTFFRVGYPCSATPTRSRRCREAELDFLSISTVKAKVLGDSVYPALQVAVYIDENFAYYGHLIIVCLMLGSLCDGASPLSPMTFAALSDA